MKEAPRDRRILHVDLSPFFVAVECSLDGELRGRPLIVGGGGASGCVVARSPEAAAAGVEPAQSLEEARRLCPEATVRPGDFEAYARANESVDSLLLHYTRRIERPTADEAFLDLSGGDAGRPVAAAEALRDELLHRLGLEASLGLARSRLAARVASARARPRGLLVVLPGYEAAFVAPQPLAWLSELSPGERQRLEAAGFSSIGSVADADTEALAAVVGPALAGRIHQAARRDHEPPIALATPPAWIHEELTLRSRGSGRSDIEALLAGLATRAATRLKRESVVAASLTVEIRRERGWLRRSETVQPALAAAPAIVAAARALASPLLDPASGVRALGLRLGRLERPVEQARLFPSAGSGAS